MASELSERKKGAEDQSRELQRLEEIVGGLEREREDAWEAQVRRVRRGYVERAPIDVSVVVAYGWEDKGESDKGSAEKSESRVATPNNGALRPGLCLPSEYGQEGLAPPGAEVVVALSAHPQAGHGANRPGAPCPGRQGL